MTKPRGVPAWIIGWPSDRLPLERGMAEIERRRAAILAADLVGFTRLMGADEAGTLTRHLKALGRAGQRFPAVRQMA